MNHPPIPEHVIPSEPDSAGRSAPGKPPRAALLFRLLAAATLIAFVVFRLDALLRVQGPLIADSSEYLLLANSLLTGAELPVAPVRNCFFALLLSGLLAPLNAVLERPFDADAARLLPLLFHAAAVLGTWVLARELVGSRVAATVAAFLVAVLPGYGYWSSDVLTDVPASACVVWAVVAWVRGKPLTSGFVFGIGVLLRYQTLLVLLPFFLVVVFTRRRRELVRFSLSLSVVPLGLALLDGLYWGTPWISIREHFGVFSDHLGSSLSPREEGASETSGGAFQWITAPLLKARYSQFIWDAPRALGWTLITAFLSYPLLRRRLERRNVGDLTFAVCVCTYLGLCFLADDDTRYLVVITPLLAAVGGGCSAVWIEQIASRLASRSEATARAFRAVGLVAFCGCFGAASWRTQQRLPYRPYGAILDAVTTAEIIESRDDPVRVGVYRPWVLVHEFPVTGTEWCSWSTDSPIQISSLDCLGSALDPLGPEERARVRSALDELAFVILTEPGPRRETASLLWASINRRASFDGVSYESDENRFPAWRFRMLSPDEGTSPFWSTSETTSSGEEPLAIFAGGLALVQVEGTAYPEVSGAIRLDLRWRFDEAPAGPMTCRVRIRNQATGGQRADSFDFVPPAWIDGKGSYAPGATTRVSRFLILPGEVPGGTIHVSVEVGSSAASDRRSAFKRQELVWNRNSTKSRWICEKSVVLVEAPAAERR